MESKNAKIYFRYIQLLDDLKKSYGKSMVDHIELDILNAVFRLSHDQQEVLVSDICAIRAIASPATMHNRISSLVKKRYLKHIEGKDARKRYLALTKNATDYFDAVSDCFLKASTH